VGKEISGKIVENVFANNECGIELTLFRHKVLLTLKEAKELRNILDSIANIMLCNEELFR